MGAWVKINEDWYQWPFGGPDQPRAPRFPRGLRLVHGEIA